jgi:hypothetical protein
MTPSSEPRGIEAIKDETHIVTVAAQAGAYGVIVNGGVDGSGFTDRASIDQSRPAPSLG